MYRRAWFLAVLLAWVARLCWADEKSFLRNAKYNEGEFGHYPTHKFKTSVIEPPRLNFMQPFSKCDDGSYIFVSPRGNSAWSSFFILDHEGGLIWGPDHRYGEVYNFQVQNYKGEPYLFFWAGDDSVGGHGEGKYYMLDQHYEEHSKISAGDGIRGDLHTFFITEQDTAVFSGYQVVQSDLSSVGLEGESWIWESLFQELDIETGEVLFEWRASEHFNFTDSYVRPNKAIHNAPWDFFHINMIDKDAAGNFLVSTRYGRCALYIDGKTGDILWILGGKANSFKDLSGGDATTFLGQHDVHWVDGHDGITMFDNRADWFNKIEDESAGHRIHVDLDKMTAELVHSYRHPEHILSTSQGSMQTLPNGNVLIGYGFNGAFTEFTPGGEAICDAYMMPSNRFGSGDVQSYRDLKFNWTGVPLTTPDLAFEEKTLYISWLGSTKVKSWLIQDSNTADGDFEAVLSTPKAGFETEYALADGERMRRYVRIIAVDQGGTQLSISHPVDLLDPVEIWGEAPAGEPEHDHDHDHNNEDGKGPEYEDDVEDVQILLILGILAMISAALVAWMTFGSGCMPLRRRLQTEKGPGGYIVAGFRDDGRWQRFWHRLRQIRIPGTRRSWRYQARPLSQVDREDIGEDVQFSQRDFSVED